jgi:DNA-binding Lrp family transcriptional regulator
MIEHRTSCGGERDAKFAAATLGRIIAARNAASPHLHMSTPSAAKASAPLDRLDLKILRQYQDNTRQPAERIATAVGLSTAAVQRRLRRMRETGVIEAEVAKIAPAKVGVPITCIVGVELVRETANGLQRFIAKMARFKQVQQCYYVTGRMDFMLVVLARDMQAYDQFMRKALLDDPNVRSYETHVVLTSAKTGTSVPVEL